MKNSTKSLHNLVVNLTKKQKLGMVALIAIIVILVIVLAVVVNQSQDDVSDGSEEGQMNTETAAGVSGDNINNEDEAVGIEVPVSTDYQSSHVYTLRDYLPKDKYDFKEFGDGETGARVYWSISENTAIEKGIVVRVDSCNEERNKASANEYLRTIPVDLSEYTIVYQVATGDVPCDVP